MLDIRGCKSGKLMGMSPTDMRQDGKVLWDTVCLKCGRHRLITARDFNKHAAGERLACEDCQEVGRPKTRLGLSGAPIYNAWQSAVSGWPDFQEFLQAMGPCPEHYQLGRLDETKPHGAGNTIWIHEHPYLGQRQGQLEAREVVYKNGRSYYRCVCDCGRTVDRWTKKFKMPSIAGIQVIPQPTGTP